jgi:hypothetical protein
MEQAGGLQRAPAVSAVPNGRTTAAAATPPALAAASLKPAGRGPFFRRLQPPSQPLTLRGLASPAAPVAGCGRRRCRQVHHQAVPDPQPHGGGPGRHQRGAGQHVRGRLVRGGLRGGRHRDGANVARPFWAGWMGERRKSRGGESKSLALRVIRLWGQGGGCRAWLGMWCGAPARPWAWDGRHWHGPPRCAGDAPEDMGAAACSCGTGGRGGRVRAGGAASSQSQRLGLPFQQLSACPLKAPRTLLGALLLCAPSPLTRRWHAYDTIKGSDWLGDQVGGSRIGGGPTSTRCGSARGGLGRAPSRAGKRGGRTVGGSEAGGTCSEGKKGGGWPLPAGLRPCIGEISDAHLFHTSTCAQPAHNLRTTCACRRTHAFCYHYYTHAYLPCKYMFSSHTSMHTHANALACK